MKQNIIHAIQPALSNQELQDIKTSVGINNEYI